MLFCSIPAVAAVGIVITMTAKVTNGVGTTAATMLGARKGARWGGTRLTCPMLLRSSRMNPSGYGRLPFGLIRYKPYTVCRSASSICHYPPPPSQLFGCSVARLTPSSSQSAPLRFIATALSPPLDRWLSCCPFACLRLSASASASRCAPPFVGLLCGIFGPLHSLVVASGLPPFPSLCLLATTAGGGCPRELSPPKPKPRPPPAIVIAIPPSSPHWLECG